MNNRSTSPNKYKLRTLIITHLQFDHQRQLTCIFYSVRKSFFSAKMFEAELDENSDHASLLTWMKLRRNIYRNRQQALEEACHKLNVSLVGTTFKPRNDSGIFKPCCHTHLCMRFFSHCGTFFKTIRALQTSNVMQKMYIGDFYSNLNSALTQYLQQALNINF